MSYQVLYRKYRPKDFSEVVGQDHIISVLKRQIVTDRVAHAYLFSGPRGVGKTTVARLIAKAANCTSSKNRPCQTCESCETFGRGQALNLIEIDAASNRGIDEIRELREQVRFVPPMGGKKVYIIDEVHQLTKEAFNALLKTLEEPPAHVVFVLATTELDKVPPTIISRTQHFDFRRPRSEVIASRLTAIATQEGVTLEPDAASLLAFIAEGSVRDAESMLGKVMAVEDVRITREEAEEILGVPRAAALKTLFGYISARDLKGALGFISQLYHEGYDMEYLAKLLVNYFREALLAKTGPVPGATRSGEENEGFGSALTAYTPQDLSRAIVELIEAYGMVKRVPIPQLPLELALINIIAEDSKRIDDKRD